MTTAWMAFFTLVVGFFTFLLWQATKNYTEVTKRILEQSKEAFEQSRRALETDVFSKLVSSTLQLDAQLRISKDQHRKIHVNGFTAGMLVALEDIDPSMFEAVSKAIKAWHTFDPGDPERIFYEALDKIEGKKEGEG